MKSQCFLFYIGTDGLVLVSHQFANKHFLIIIGNAGGRNLIRNL